MTTIVWTSLALAFEVQTLPTGEEMRFFEMPVTYAWVEGDAPNLNGLETAIDASFDAWANVDDAYVFAEKQTSSLAPEVALDDENLVFFTTDWPAGNEALAITTSWADDAGHIVQYDIYINATIPWSTTGAKDAFDLQAAITHEVGHVLGIGHSEVAEATMFAKHEPGDVQRRVLDSDDQEAARYLYDSPPAAPEDTGATDESSSGCNAIAVGPTGASWAGLLTLAFLYRRGEP
ncbi:MAG: matrixin family metalloprotease [Myxococcota bacterium]